MTNTDKRDERRRRRAKERREARKTAKQEKAADNMAQSKGSTANIIMQRRKQTSHKTIMDLIN